MKPRNLELTMGQEHFRFHTSARTAGRFGFTWTLAAGGKGPEQHLHPHESERFEVVTGQLHIWLDGVRNELGPGASLVVEPGVFHRFLNPGNEPVVVEVSLDGPLLEDMFLPLTARSDGPATITAREMFRAAPHLADAVSKGAMIPRSALALRLFGALAALARLMGHRPLPRVVGWDSRSEGQAISGLGDAMVVRES